jgi:hypothetical protein
MGMQQIYLCNHENVVLCRVLRKDMDIGRTAGSAWKAGRPRAACAHGRRRARGCAERREIAGSRGVSQAVAGWRGPRKAAHPATRQPFEGRENRVAARVGPISAKAGPCFAFPCCIPIKAWYCGKCAALARLLFDILRTSRTATAKKREGGHGHPCKSLPVLHEPFPGDSPAAVFIQSAVSPVPPSGQWV